MTGTKGIVALAVIAIAILSGALFWQFRRAELAEKQVGLDASRVLSAIFVQAQDIRVATLRGEVQARSQYDGVIFDPKQTTIAPYRASYFIDLGEIGRANYTWDASRQIMTISIPDVSVEDPAIDMSKARVFQEGRWISRKAGTTMNKDAAARLSAGASAKANSQEYMDKARASAIVAVRRFVKQPLVAAGFNYVDVDVRFDWEGRRSPEQQDRSRRMEDVIAD